MSTLKGTGQLAGALTASMYIAFSAIAGYTVFTGLREVPSLYVEHLPAGAGSPLLLWCGVLAVLATLSLLRWYRQRNEAMTVWRILLVAAPIGLTVFLPGLLEQRAAGFSEGTFKVVTTAYDGGELLTQHHVAEVLGEPVARRTDNDRDLWSYTYMPSAGIGWQKRMVWFDDTGKMVGYVNMNEP